MIASVRSASFTTISDTSISIPCAQQILTSMRIIMGEETPGEGAKRLADLHRNSVYFRRRLKELGFAVFGDEDSPIIPVMTYSLTKTASLAHRCIERNIAVVVAGYPATPLLLCRARFCMSAAHSLDDLEWALQELVQIGDDVLIRDSELNPASLPKQQGNHKRAVTTFAPERVATIAPNSKVVLRSLKS
jgi:serine palmitoyltransferase